jgi:anion-transporting  ArsA/GET3 family ATPase
MSDSKAALVTVFCGKGGVGKTSISLALGLRHAIQKRPTVVVTSHPLSELAASVSLAGIKERYPEAADALFVIHINPREVLDNTVKKGIPSSILINAVLSSSVYRSLVEVAPGLKEIAFLNRLHRLAEERSEAGKNFDRVVWDAPATGHFLQTLRVSRSFEQYLSGPFALLGAQLARFSSDSTQIAVVPITTLEEMAVEETIDLWRQLGDDLAIVPRAVLCNMTSPLARSTQPVEQLRGQLEAEGDDGAIEFILDRNAIERSLFSKLRAALPGALHLIARKASWTTDLDLLLDIANQMEDFPDAWTQ